MGATKLFFAQKKYLLILLLVAVVFVSGCDTQSLGPPKDPQQRFSGLKDPQKLAAEKSGVQSLVGNYLKKANIDDIQQTNIGAVAVITQVKRQH